MRVCLEVTSQTRNPYAMQNWLNNNFEIENRGSKVFACKEVEENG